MYPEAAQEHQKRWPEPSEEWISLNMWKSKPTIPQASYYPLVTVYGQTTFTMTFPFLSYSHLLGYPVLFFLLNTSKYNKDVHLSII